MASFGILDKMIPVLLGQLSKVSADDLESAVTSLNDITYHMLQNDRAALETELENAGLSRNINLAILEVFEKINAVEHQA
ncbi:MAG: hypothetical protein WC734_06150 [Patescibacteria group bacterium]|jgi:hypothetical protein